MIPQFTDYFISEFSQLLIIYILLGCDSLFYVYTETGLLEVQFHRYIVSTHRSNKNDRTEQCWLLALYTLYNKTKPEVI
jgi:hypothetical protein